MRPSAEPDTMAASTSWATLLRGGALTLCVAAAGCGGKTMLVMSPYVVVNEGPEAFEAGVPESLRTPNFPIIYATDRAPHGIPEEDEEQSFSWRRGTGLRYGVATVELSPKLDWSELVKESTTSSRGGIYQLRLAEVLPVGTIRNFFEWVSVSDDRLVLLPDALEAMSEERAKFHALVQSRLADAPQKTAMVFVHGFNNGFDHSIFRTAELWHFTGRQSVPFAYSWPAARGGLRGYTYDRESGEYTVSHLKQFLRALASTPGLERIDIVAHSRGTDVTVTALRELYIEAKAGGEEPVSAMKLGSLILAAPDIDTQVFGQRFGAEMLTNAPERTVIYFSPDDQAIWWAEWLFDSVRRLGSLVLEDLSEQERASIAKLPRLQLIDCDVSGFGTSHAYVFSHPAAMSDVVQVLRAHAPPGSPERPLASPIDGAWRLDNSYCRPKPKRVDAE